MEGGAFGAQGLGGAAGVGSFLAEASLKVVECQLVDGTELTTAFFRNSCPVVLAGLVFVALEGDVFS
ncbi:hypothetical protein [Armatimonas sp.]|uniref:hypothetical protein n=1 Tax=Armatimonas sp. TaxID=1872638 RepID=UPI00286A993E|nr:hypothetical protein [Armatimonas sp.]